MPRKTDPVDELELEDDFDAEADEESDAAPTKKAKAPSGVGATQIANHVGADAKTFRAWLRRMVASDSIAGLEHEHKGRYNFGKTITSPLAKRVIKLWNESSHERGRKAAEDEDE